jgi:hypothetical protein
MGNVLEITNERCHKLPLLYRHNMAAPWTFPAERGAHRDQAEDKAVLRRRAEDIIATSREALERSRALLEQDPSCTTQRD